MKKIISLALVSTMTLSLLTGCGGKETTIDVSDATDSIKQEVVLPEINAGEIRNDGLSSEIDAGNAELGDDKVNITDIGNGSIINPDNRHIYNGGTWYYDQLNDVEKNAYKTIKNSLETAAGKKEDLLVFLDITDEIQMLKVYRAVLEDNPQILIQNIGDGEIEQLYDGGNEPSGISFKLNFDKYWSDVNVEVAQEELEKEIKKIMKQMDDIDGDYNKVLWLYNYLINSIEYNLDVPWHPTMYGALVMKECACEGISEAFEYILNLYGIKTIGVSGMSGLVINGVSDINGHKWNMVMLDGEWYAFDVTWDIDKDLSKFLPYTYFAVNQEDISFAHAPFFPEMVPNATGEKYNYYKYNNLVVHSYNIEELIRVGKACYTLNPGYFSFKFESKYDFTKALNSSEYNQWIPKVIQANKLTKWQYLIRYNPDLQIIEFAIFDSYQDPKDYQ